MSQTKSAKIRSQLKHPVVDADGHWLETQPVFTGYLAEMAGGKTVDRYKAVLDRAAGFNFYKNPLESMVRNRSRRQGWWGHPTNARDRSAVMLPGLMRDSLDDWGIDVALIYPSLGFMLLPVVREPDLRQAVVRAYNVMVADMFGPHGDRLIPAGVVSLDTPAEALDLLQQARELGLKSVVMNGAVQRPIEADADWQPEPSRRRHYMDAFGLDSPYDYDPVWAKCMELKFAVTVHTGSMGWPDRSSPTNYVLNHMGHFAQSHHLTARTLFMGGVTERFPNLKFGFLEGGAGWACNLYGDLVGHWKKRNKTAAHAHLKPTNLDLDEVRRQMQRYGSSNRFIAERMDDILARHMDVIEMGVSQQEFAQRDLDTDDYAKVHIESERDIRRLYTRNFYFGCEADDPMTAMAFHEKAGIRLKAMLGSDIGHFDVRDATEVVEEAWEMVEHGLLTEQNFREFAFTNVVELHGSMNPAFFNGTVVEQAAAEEMKRAQERSAAGD